MSDRSKYFKGSPVKRKMYEHMETTKQPIMEVCPITGSYIDPKPVDMVLVVNHHMKRDKNPIEPLRSYKARGIGDLTQDEVKTAYDIIKGFKDGQ